MFCLVEAESDQEPSSTVDNAAATVWNGCINMVDVARFYVAAHEVYIFLLMTSPDFIYKLCNVINLFIIFQVSGSASDLEDDLSAELDIVGRINPDTVWDYIGKMKRASNKDIVILRLQAANDEEKMQYIALYSYLSSRNRFVDCLNYSFNKIYYFPNNYYLNLFKFGFLFIYLYSF